MNLNRRILFLGIFLLGLITNFCVLYDFRHYSIMSFFSLFFFTLVPGLLVMLILKIKELKFWEYLVYTIGLSISFLMFLGLAVNWILPVMHFTNRPFTPPSILFSFDIILLIFGIIAYIRNKNLSYIIKSPKLDSLNKVFFLTPLIFLFLSILGAIILNNGGSNNLTMAMLLGVATYVFFVVLLHNKLNEHVFPWAIVIMSFSLLLMFSIRSWHLSGWDIHQEYYVFQLTKNNFHWSINSFYDVYNACLSITIFPTIISNVSGINDDYIFKLIYPLIFGFIPLCVYLLIKRVAKLSIITFLSCIFFLIQPSYFIGFTMVLRQGIAFLFLGLLLIIIFDQKFESLNKKILFYILCFSMIVSHYSTTYVTISMFSFVYLLTKLSQILKCKETVFLNNLNKTLGPESTAKNISFLMIAVMSIFTFYWYGMANATGNNILSFTHSIFINSRNIIKNEFSLGESSLLTQLNIFYKVDTYKFFKEYISTSNQKAGTITNTVLYSNNQNYVDRLHLITLEYIPQKIPDKLIVLIYTLIELIKKLTKLFTLVGVLYFANNLSKLNSTNRSMLLFMIASLLLLTLGIVIPQVSVDYDLLRLFQQTLFFLSFPTIFGGILMIKWVVRSHSYLLLTLLIIIYFFSSTGVVQQMIGGSTPSMQLNNLGENYDRFYIFDEDIKSAKWLQKNYVYNTNIYADKFASWILMSQANFTNTIEDVLPTTISKNSYVYLRNSNAVKDLNFKRYKDKWLNFSYPNDFLKDNKNLIYSNKRSKIYY